MTALSAAIAIPLLPNVEPGSFGQAAGYAGVLLFGLGTAVYIWRLLRSTRPLVTLSPEGIRDTRVAAEFVPWLAIRGISTWEYSWQKVMVLAVDPAVEGQLTLTPIAKWTRGVNRALGADGLCITAQGLKIGYNALLETSVAYAQAAQRAPRTVPAHEPEAKNVSDFSHVESREIAAKLSAEGKLSKILLFPAEFGGADVPPNTVYVPPGIPEIKDQLTGTLIGFVNEGAVNQLKVEPEYKGNSFVPAKIRLKAWHSEKPDGGFESTIDIW